MTFTSALIVERSTTGTRSSIKEQGRGWDLVPLHGKFYHKILMVLRPGAVGTFPKHIQLFVLHYDYYCFTIITKHISLFVQDLG